MRKGIFLIFQSLILTACGHFVRSTQSGYRSAAEIQRNQIDREDARMSQHKMSKALAEQGMSPDDLKSNDGYTKIQNALEIKQLESQLRSDRERNQYYKTLPWLKDEEEQLEFLRQNGYYARQVWLRQRAIGKRATVIDKEDEDLIASKDIAVGMPNELVRRSWGAPDSIDVAGNPIYGNERWRYKRYTPSPDGYRLQSRIIYFESGKVAGWEQIDH